MSLYVHKTLCALQIISYRMRLFLRGLSLLTTLFFSPSLLHYFLSLWLCMTVKVWGPLKAVNLLLEVRKQGPPPHRNLLFNTHTFLLRALRTPWHAVLLLLLLLFIFFLHQLMLRNYLKKRNKKQVNWARVSCVLFVWRWHFLWKEGGGEDRVSCNYIYVGSHSVCHSKFCLTCHIVNHYCGLNGGYELKRQRKNPFYPCDRCICLFLTS